MTSTTSSERIHGLDALRGFALLLGVALHAAMSYLPGAEFFWVASDGNRSMLVLPAGFHWVHSFRMTLFFVLAGFFGRMALHRLGAGAFVRDRFKRIVLPLLAFWCPVLVAITAVIVWNAWLKNGGAMPEPTPQPPLTLRSFPLTHLWFLYLLAIFLAAMLLMRTAFHAIDRGGRMQAMLDAVVRAIGGPWAPLVLGVPAMLALMSLPAWWHWFGIPTPDMTLIPNLAACVAYGLAFLAGWALHRQPTLLAALSRRWRLNLAIALVASATCFQQVGVTPPAAPAGDDLATWIYAFAYATASWAWSLALIGLVLRFLDGHSPVRRYLADASYWIYIVHLPLVMAAQVLASRLQAPWWIEYPAIVVAVLAVCLLSYRLLVRHSWIGGWLNGRRVPRSRVPAHAARTAS